MAYSLIAPGVSADDFGSGMQGGFGGFLGRWGDATRRGLTGGMTLGTQLTNYGTNQRLAGMRETNARQALNTGLVASQNEQLDQQTAQTRLACTRIGWASDYCQAFKAKLEGRIPQLGVEGAYGGEAGVAGGSAIGAQGSLRSFDAQYNDPSTVLGTDPGYSAEQGWYE
ncbi:MAG TPA: hypothetical protein PLQ87_02555 [Phycisphaerae bacterium]|nr:hypothetical protein [Phycisphaerae bacterium]